MRVAKNLSLLHTAETSNIRIFCTLYYQCVLLSGAIVSGMRDRAGTAEARLHLVFAATGDRATEFSADFSNDQCFELSFASAPCETHSVTEIFRNFLEKLYLFLKKVYKKRVPSSTC